MSERRDDGGDRPNQIDAWVEEEFQPWRTAGGWASVGEAAAEILAIDDSVYLFSICDGNVSFADKNAHWADPAHPLYDRWRALIFRARKYRALFEVALSVFGIAGSADLLFDLDDLGGEPTTAPVFAFQKRRGSHHLLVPDIDFLVGSFYLSPESKDPVPLTEKLDRAVFVGSTTGMLNISQHTLAANAHQRIRSAQYFRGSEDVLFELPNVVQCDGPVTEAAIRALGLGDKMRSWAEQFDYRYILSLDGNGATCSRVAIALGSNSVLLKYESPNILFYFRGMVPWRHFVPICDDEDVRPAIAFLRARPALAAAVVAAAHCFRSRYLSRIGTLTYTAGMLRRYLEQFGSGAGAGASVSTEAAFLIDTSGVFADGIEQWSVPAGWLSHHDGLPLWSIELNPGPALDPAALRWTTTHLDGRSRENCSGVRGSRSDNGDSAITGLTISPTGADAGRYLLGYSARFADGTSVGPVPSGSWCRAPSGAPLVALRIVTASL